MPGQGDRLLTTTRTLLPLAALLLLAACGGGEDDDAAAPVVVTPTAPLPCTATSGLDLPRGWPSALPLPDGLVVDRTETRTGDRLIAYGRVPGDFHSVVDFFNARLPAAGFTQDNGEIDPRDAESDFSGSATRGRWTTGASNDCPGSAQVSVLVLPAGSDPGEDGDKDKDKDRDG